MKLKILIITIFLSSILTNIVGCNNVESAVVEFFTNEYVHEGVTYQKLGMKGKEPYYAVKGIYDENNVGKNVYVYDEINGHSVTACGVGSPVAGTVMFIEHSRVERIYFPWSITFSKDIIASVERGYEETLEYIFSASNSEIIVSHSIGSSSKNVVSYYLIEKIYAGVSIGGEKIHSNSIESFVPANISFRFNYPNNPNEGYFFIDLLEESGKLTKPPYDPKRDGYNFSGWYKEAECINEWNFDTDIVTIEYDENGERIYEEIKLYAKWEINN